MILILGLLAACNKNPSGVIIIIEPNSSAPTPGDQRNEQLEERGQGMLLLTTDSEILERCYTQQFTYTSAKCQSLHKTSDGGDYALDPKMKITSDSYSLVINNDSAPIDNPDCETMALDQTGAKTATDTSSKDTSQECWDDQP